MALLEAEIRGTVLKGEATDMDSYFFSGYLLEEYRDILQSEKGLVEAFNAFSAEQRAMAAILSPDEKEDASTRLMASWGERVLLRLNVNLDMRAAFAQRVVEIFPDINREWVDYKRWRDREGNLIEETRIRIDSREVISLMSAIMNQVESVAAIAPPAAVPTSPQTTPQQSIAPAAINAPAQVPSEIEQLKAKIASLESQIRVQPTRTTPQGFAVSSAPLPKPD